MVAYTGAMHVARNKRGYVAKSGEQRVYESVLLRRTYRDGTAVRHETLANLSKLPPEAVEAIEATLKGQTLIPAGSEFTITRSLPHGHAAAVAAMAHRLGFPALLGPPCRSRDLVFALIISRGDPSGVQAVHPVGLARHRVGCRSGCRRRDHRRDLRGDGLAG